jgi:non-ribosomal peptide synthetase component F
MLSVHYHQTMQQLLPQDERLLDTIVLAGERDLDQAMSWNGDAPKLVESCIHELIAEQARRRPEAPAISAWDGAFTYRELNELATKLASSMIQDHGVRPGDLVPVCFEKSAWFFVAIVAVNKAGAAWVPLDPSHPAQRLQHIVGQTKARFALASPGNLDRCAGIVESVLAVTADLLGRLASDQRPVLTAAVTPEHAAYVLFTSGSTGTPKGLVMQHQAVCTSQTAIAERLGLTEEVRMLQFAAFVFDLCIGEIVAHYDPPIFLDLSCCCWPVRRCPRTSSTRGSARCGS